MEPTVVSTARESARIAALLRYDLLDRPTEREFDDMVERTARETGFPAAILSLVDTERCWFVAATGLPPDLQARRELPRGESFCHAACASSRVFAVTDAHADPRFAHLKTVDRPNGFRAYAGAQLITPDGHSIGTLCILDPQPRELTPAGHATLRHLANEAMMMIEARRLRSTPPAEPTHNRSLAVLLVDDDPNLRAVIGAMLRLLGHTVREAGNGIEALRLFREQPDAVQLVLTDLHMNEMDGLSLLRALHAEARPPARIAMSGRLDEQLRRDLVAAGAQALLDKPFTLESLEEAIAGAVAR